MVIIFFVGDLKLSRRLSLKIIFELRKNVVSSFWSGSNFSKLSFLQKITKITELKKKKHFRITKSQIMQKQENVVR